MNGPEPATSLPSEHPTGLADCLSAGTAGQALGRLLERLRTSSGASWAAVRHAGETVSGEALLAASGSPGPSRESRNWPLHPAGAAGLEFSLGWDSPAPGGEDLEQLVDPLLPIVGLLAKNQALEARLGRQRLLMRFTEDMMLRIGKDATEEDLLGDLAAFLLEAFPVDRVTLMGVTTDRKWGVVRTVRDRRPDSPEPPAIPIALPDVTELARTLRAGEFLVFPDVRLPGTPEHLARAAENARVRSSLIAPITEAAGLWGVAVLSRESVGAPLDGEDCEILRTLLQQAGPLLSNQRMMRTLAHGLASLEVLLDTSREVSSVLDLSEVPRLVAKRAMELTEADEAVVFLHEPATGKLRPVLALSPYEAEMMKLEISVGEGVAGYVARTRRGEYVNRVDLDPRSRYIPGTPTEPEALLAAPLVCADRLIGVMSLYKLGERNFSDPDLATINIFATQAAIAIENARLFQRMEEERANLAIMLEQMEESVVLCDVEGRVRLINPAAEALLSSGAGGRLLSEVFPDDLAQDIADIVRRIGTGEERHVTREFHLRGRICLASFTAIRDEKGHLLGHMTLWKDITDLKTIESQLLQSSKMSAVGQLASGVAHEFNNLIAAIYGYAQFMKDNRDEKLFEKGIRIILSSSERARDLTRSLLTFSRVTEGRQEALDLNELMNDVLLLVEQQLSKEGIRVERDYGRLPHVLAERSRLQEVFLNVLSNARHAMPNGGILTFRSRVEPEGLIVEVSDTGVGIAPEHLPKIFEPFFTTKGPLNGTRVPGTGLGLFTVYNIVQAHGGRVEVASVPGEGTTVRLRFPTGGGAAAPRIEGSDSSVAPAAPGA
jgi:PAS domain S-box-containing protein